MWDCTPTWNDSLINCKLIQFDFKKKKSTRKVHVADNGKNMVLETNLEVWWKARLSYIEKIKEKMQFIKFLSLMTEFEEMG